MSEPTMIEIRGLTKTYQVGDVPVHALRGVDLDVEQGGNGGCDVGHIHDLVGMALPDTPTHE